MTTSTRKPNDGNDEQLEKLVSEYLRQCGRLIPQTPEDVAAAEEWLREQDIQVPDTLLTRDGCSLSRRQAGPNVLPFPTRSSDAVEYLARAAREGRAISPEVEEQMKRDREQKEREAEGDE